jgi:hypothetical protein
MLDIDHPMVVEMVGRQINSNSERKKNHPKRFTSNTIFQESSPSQDVPL